MIFQKLIIKNFRQFYGKQTINFATDKHKNITVIHGFNGAGKTTLLNVFTWLLYGEFSPDFENPEYLETEAAFARVEPGGELETYAQLTFQDKGREYKAERKIIVKKNNNKQRIIEQSSQLKLMYIDEAGEIRESSNPQDSIEQLLPQCLSHFFFFNGERIEKLANLDAYEQIESGVKVLLDIEVFDRAINHLDRNSTIARELREEIAKNSGDKGEKARQELEQIQAKKTKATEKLTQSQKNIKALQEEKERIDSKLSEMPELAKWQAEREAKEKELKDNRDKLKDSYNDSAKKISKNGYLVLAPNVLTEAKKILEQAHKKGELPIPIKRQFVSELLEKGKCICDRNLIEGELPYDCVKQWRDSVGSDLLEGAVSVTKAKLESLFERRETVLKDIAIIQEKRENIHGEIRRLQEELSELSSKIGNREHGENHSRLEARRNDIESEVVNLSLEIEKYKNEISGLEQQVRDKDREIKQLDKVNERGKIAQNRLNAINNVKLAIEKIRKLRHQQLSRDLSQRLSEVWSRIAIKDYQAKLDDSYHLHLTKNIAGIETPVRGASTGEKQVLSLAFIGSLVDKARATYDESGDRNKKILFKGGLYPLVIDSAFGQLEPDYKRDVAKWIPTLAPQVIVLVSESQWKQEVEQELQARIGTQWILELSNTKDRSKNITLRGREYPYVVESRDRFERTTIKEV